MENRFGFTLMSSNEFVQWIKDQQIARTIRFVQLHHTWIPSYAHFNGSNHFAMQNGMKNTHVNNNGWMDIGQHFTIFPDGMVCTGRHLENSPSCIYMNNARAICIENVGNFDVGGDQMTSAQANSIVSVTAQLCKRFNLLVDDAHVVYHHWFAFSGERNNGTSNSKSCPGTNFFGGNKVADFNANLKPLILNSLQNTPTGTLPLKLKRLAYVATTRLIVRAGPGTNFTRTGTAELGGVLRVYDEKDLWIRISESREEWVYGRYTVTIQLGKVNATTLNVRSGPSTNFPKVFALQKGQEVAIMETSNGWHRIGLNDIWVSASFIDPV